ncbi:MAG TPA: phosphatase PAP2 family protein [Symbiobacteriaceae bacterium]|jgi:undecaprenyl-diphosphatase
MDVWLFQQLNQWAGWGYWTDYLAFVMAQWSLAIHGVLLAVRWFMPSRDRRRERHTVLLALAGAVFAIGMADLSTRFYYRPRPFLEQPGAFDLLQTHATPSFPSTHAAASFALATHMGWRSPGWGLITWPLSLLESASRIYAGVHYPTDTLAGMLLGVLTALFLRMLAPNLEPALDQVLELVGAAPKRE